MRYDRDLKARGGRRAVAVAISLCACAALTLFAACAKMPHRQYFMLNYEPAKMQHRAMENPYAAVIRVREFSIEEAYNRPQIVYRMSRYELRYYNYKSWAVKPTRMLTDLFYKHMNSEQIVSGLVRRFDEGRKPDYELTGFIEALEEFDSDDLLFAHVAVRLTLTNLSSGTTLYSRLFDLRRRVYTRDTHAVIKEMSQIMEYIFTEAISDIDAKLAAEFGIAEFEGPSFTPVEEPTFMTEE
ncbi:MAG: ABC-type transport auxiliary lipoprotein family protein [Chitinispirillia bacterium]|nr:ABC-type transport auxiliary lipoprotein family protein [Chitinispirillia bacterium]MCL2242649.1 ABC-type transport auxiliary lipoprotein family protein [Chitinispirillia bacterium]